MGSIDEVISSIQANKEASDPLAAQIEASKAQNDEVFNIVHSMGAEALANAVATVKETLEQASAQNAALSNQLEQAANAAVTAKHT